MTRRKKLGAGKGKARSLRLKKQTLKDLGSKRQPRAVRGGVLGLPGKTFDITCPCTEPFNTCKCAVP
jgi:hypothetical protein